MSFCHSPRFEHPIPPEREFENRNLHMSERKAAEIKGVEEDEYYQQVATFRAQSQKKSERDHFYVDLIHSSSPEVAKEKRQAYGRDLKSQMSENERRKRMNHSQDLRQGNDMLQRETYHNSVLANRGHVERQRVTECSDYNLHKAEDEKAARRLLEEQEKARERMAMANGSFLDRFGTSLH